MRKRFLFLSCRYMFESLPALLFYQPEACEEPCAMLRKTTEENCHFAVIANLFCFLHYEYVAVSVTSGCFKNIHPPPLPTYVCFMSSLATRGTRCFAVAQQDDARHSVSSRATQGHCHFAVLDTKNNLFKLIYTYPSSPSGKYYRIN